VGGPDQGQRVGSRAAVGCGDGTEGRLYGDRQAPVAILRRVGGAHYCAPHPSEPCERFVTAHGSSRPHGRFGLLCSCAAVKILPRDCRTSPRPPANRCGPVHQRPARREAGPPVRSPCGVQLVLRCRRSRRVAFTGPPATRQHPLGSGHPARYPASYTQRPPAEEPVCAGRAFLLPFGHRRSLLGHPVPPREFGPPYGRLTTSPRLRGEADPGEVSMFRTPETRLGWVSSVLRGRRCSRDRSVVLGRRLPPLHGAVPATPVVLPVPRFDNDEASARLHGHSPGQPSPRL
jgi:hypothetical protein